MPFWHMDAAMASLLILQTAVDAGLGACFFGVPSAVLDAVREAFGIPVAYKPVGAITVGHPAPGGAAGSPTRRRRKPHDEVVHRGRRGSCTRRLGMGQSTRCGAVAPLPLPGCLGSENPMGDYAELSRGT